MLTRWPPSGRRALRIGDRRLGAQTIRPVPRRRWSGAAGGCPRSSQRRAGSAAKSCPLARTQARSHRPATSRDGVDLLRCSRVRARRFAGAGELRPGDEARMVRRRVRAGCGGHRWRLCARRSNPPTSARWRPSCRRGRGSTAIPPRVPASTVCARCSWPCRGSRCRPRYGSATCCRGASAPTRRHGWTTFAPPARSCGPAPLRSFARRDGGVVFRDEASERALSCRAALARLPSRSTT